MKKLFLSAAFVFIAFTTHALPLGNPADASLLEEETFFCGDWEGGCIDWFGFRFGFYGDYVFDRKMEFDLPGHPKLERVEINTNAAYLALNFCNWIDLFATLGVSHMILEFDDLGQPPLLPKVEVDTSREFSWGLGLRWSAYEWCGWTLGLEGQYTHFSNEVHKLFVAGVLVDLAVFDDLKATYEEWQVGAGLSYRIAIGAEGRTALVPYIGYAYSDTKYEFPQQSFSSGQNSISGGGDIDGELHSSFAFGVTLVGCERIGVTTEARFGAETAFHVNGQLRF